MIKQISPMKSPVFVNHQMVEVFKSFKSPGRIHEFQNVADFYFYSLYDMYIAASAHNKQ